jgi:Taurine catabolism dioxygenase TauD, TfdA family
MDEVLTPFPESAIISVPRALANDLLKSAEDLPVYDNKDFYSKTLQTLISDSIRESCSDHFEWIVGRIKERVTRWPYSVLIRGLHFDRGNRLFVAINRAFGAMVALPYQAPRAQLVHYIQPSTDKLSARGGRESERLHTDAADWGKPIGFISMLCVRGDKGGQGRSRLLDVDTILDEVSTKLGSDSLQLLKTQPVPWQLHACWGGGVRWRTVLTESTICWRRYTIHLAVDVDGARVSKEMMTLMDDFEKVIEGSRHRIDFLMNEGELLFSDNMRGVHARTSILNAGASNRLMIRSWIEAV